MVRGTSPISQVSQEFSESVTSKANSSVKCLVWFLWGHPRSIFSLSVSQDYLGCIIDCGDLPLKPEEVSTLFCNIEDIYEFNRWVSLFLVSVWVAAVSAEFVSNTITGLGPGLSHHEGQCADVCQEWVYTISDALQQTVPGLLLLIWNALQETFSQPFSRRNLSSF